MAKRIKKKYCICIRVIRHINVSHLLTHNLARSCTLQGRCKSKVVPEDDISIDDLLYLFSSSPHSHKVLAVASRNPHYFSADFVRATPVWILCGPRRCGFCAGHAGAKSIKIFPCLSSGVGS